MTAAMTAPKIDPPDVSLRALGPLKPGDLADRTVGFRQSRPQNCGKNSLTTVCAFARDDGICLVPPTSWKKQYAVLSGRGKAHR